MPFALWSVAARIAERPREAYARQLEPVVRVYIETPAGRYDDVDLRLRTTRSTLQPMTLGEIGHVAPALAGIRLLPVLAPASAFADPVPLSAPPRALFRPQVSVDVRNMSDILLQDREFTWGEARALAVFAESGIDLAQRDRCVHYDDPLGAKRLVNGNLLPRSGADAADEQTLTGVNYFQAFAMTRLLGVAVGGDAELFRLPLGCELELAAFGRAPRAACSGVRANGGVVSIEAFFAAAKLRTAANTRAAGDVVPTDYGIDFVGLDFGVREWVLDLPHIPGAEMLLREWIGDHDGHLRRADQMAKGTVVPTPDPVGPLRSLGVVRGLACGERNGLLQRNGDPLVVRDSGWLPDSVPGVLRTEQLRRDGSGLLPSEPDPRLRLIGFRVAARARPLAQRWGYR